jgi:hypothetical protein
VTPGQASVHAIATAPTSTPCFCATSRKRVAQREVAPEVRLLEVGRAPAPVVGRHRGDALRAERVGEQARLHRAVNDDARAVLAAPRQLARRHVAPDQRERRLQRLHVTQRRASLEQSVV